MFKNMNQTESVYLEESRIRRLFVVLLGCVLPRNPEHGLVLILPAQPLIFPTLYLSYQPLFHVHLHPRFHHLQHRLCLTGTKRHFQMAKRYMCKVARAVFFITTLPAEENINVFYSDAAQSAKILLITML